MKQRSRGRLDFGAKLFRGLADLSRLAILEALRLRPRTVSQVVARTGLSQPSASMHLDCLWCCGLVDRDTVGRYTVYRLKSKKVLRVLEAAEDLLGEVRDRIAECRRYDERKAGL
ncbi:MAG TPA: metalloregulator ArsR/SmtB family transcription factor [Planctomycetota bacterium]|nr:metalloregulator ArsR/SmtB family transcription factor [Planctomycetota bacterium]